jgi:hypothetical protein
VFGKKSKVCLSEGLYRGIKTILTAFSKNVERVLVEFLVEFCVEFLVEFWAEVLVKFLIEFWAEFLDKFLD